MKQAYPAKLRKTAGGGVELRLPDVPEVRTQGETRDVAIGRAESALDAALEVRAAHDDIPQPGSLGDAYVLPCARIQAALLFRGHRGDVSTAELSRRLKNSAWKRVRDFEVATNVTLDRADRAARALGYRLVLSYEEDPTRTATEGHRDKDEGR